MSRIQPRTGRFGICLLVAATTVLLLSACDPIPPVEQPPPHGLPNGVPPAATRAEPVLPTPAGWPFPDRFPRTSGTSPLTGGALEWTDFIYDDHGALGRTGRRSRRRAWRPPIGTYQYPAGTGRRQRRRHLPAGHRP